MRIAGRGGADRRRARDPRRGDAVRAAEAGPVPIALVAVTVKVYAVPLVRPVTTWDVPVVPALLSTPPAGFDVTV